MARERADRMAEESRRSRGAVLALQAKWRGAAVRARAGPAVAAAREKLARATARATAADTVGAKTRAAVRNLLRSGSLSRVQSACQQLLALAPSGPFVGDAMAASSAVPVVLAALRSCNLSRPHRKLASLCMRLLAESTRGSRACRRALAHAAEATDVLADAAQLYRDDPVGLLAPALELLAGAVAARTGASAWAGVTSASGKAMGEGVRKKLSALRKALRRKLAALQAAGAGPGVRTRSQRRAQGGRAASGGSSSGSSGGSGVVPSSPTRQESIRGLTRALASLDDALHPGSRVSPVKLSMPR